MEDPRHGFVRHNFVMCTRRCCVPNCSSLEMKHVAFYGIKSSWHKTISAYVQKLIARYPHIPKNAKLRSNVICGKHYRLCGLRHSGHDILYHFPMLRITVSSYSRKPANFDEVFFLDDASVDHEEVFPKVKEMNPVDLSKVKQKIAPPKQVTTHVDHNYAMGADFVRFLKYEYERCMEEHDKESKVAKERIKAYEAEIQRLKDINHDLLKTNMNKRTVSFPLHLIPDNEQLLKFYTGFACKENFKAFIDILLPKYLERRKQESGEVRKQHLGMVAQLVLVLSRLRLGLMHNDLAYRFNVSLTTVLKIWMFWINLLTDVIVSYDYGDDRNNHKVIVECCETFFETSRETKTKAEKTYGRGRALIELDPLGLVVSSSDLFASYVTNEEIIKNWRKAKSKKRNANTPNKDPGKIGGSGDLQTHVQKILGFVTGFKILKGTFPNSVTSVKQLNVFWRICCFLINYSRPEIVIRAVGGNEKSPTVL